jgi:tRNA(Leu) C34 or U34 (ribose-2'-O)-methylase TrmL
MNREPLSAKRCGCLFEGSRKLRACLEHGATLPLIGSGVILINPKYMRNVGGILRTCSSCHIDNLLWTGKRVNPHEYDKLPREERMRGYADVQWGVADKPLDLFAKGIIPVAVEVTDKAQPLNSFDHPDRAAYIFGPEDGSIPQVYRALAHRFIYIPAFHCFNLSVAVGIVLQHRLMQRIDQGLDPPVTAGQAEKRGYGQQDDDVLETVGWNSK